MPDQRGHRGQALGQLIVIALALLVVAFAHVAHMVSMAVTAMGWFLAKASESCRSMPAGVPRAWQSARAWAAALCEPWSLEPSFSGEPLWTPEQLLASRGAESKTPQRGHPALSTITEDVRSGEREPNWGTGSDVLVTENVRLVVTHRAVTVED
jgi:hypothetical protein